MSCSSLSNDPVPSALLQKDVLSDCANCGQAPSLPICAVQCAHCATYVSAILKFPLKGQSPVSTQDSKNFGPAGLGFLIPYTFYFVCWCWNSILFCHLQNVKSVLFRIVMCLWLAVLHAPSKKVWPLLINPLPHPVFPLFTVWLNRVAPRVFVVVFGAPKKICQKNPKKYILGKPQVSCSSLSNDSVSSALLQKDVVTRLYPFPFAPCSVLTTPRM